MGNRKSYSKEFKEQAVDLVRKAGKSINEVARELDIATSTLCGWLKSKDEHKEFAFPGKGKLHEDDEIRRLKKENANLKLENEILKKATAIFAKSQK
ncbi:UNVERIFIED_CONTAM: transposase [Acetivibrio alkalicellulosi]